MSSQSASPAILPPEGASADGGFSTRRTPAQMLAQYGVIAAMVLTFVVFSMAKPDSFFTMITFKAMIRDAAPLLIVAVGVTVVLIVNDFDLSIGGLIGLGGTLAVVAVSGVKLGLPVPAAVILALVAGGLVGLLSGTLIAYLGASSFIITLAMGTLLNGVDTQILGANSIYEEIPSSYASIANGTLLGISNQAFVALAIVLVVAGVLRHLEVGRYLYAIGGNREAARLSGVRVRALVTASFAASGVCAVLAGILVSAQAGSANPNSGLGFLLPAYAAAFLGSSMWKPGTFTVFGTLLGAIFLQIIGTGLSLFSLSGAIVSIIQGAILVAAVLLSGVDRR